MNKIEGLIAATFGAFNEDGSLNLELIPAIVERMIEDGLTGVFVCGTNGEGPNMTMEERMAVAEAYVNASDRRIRVFVHVGHTSIAEAKRLAKHAEQIGADAISSVAAFYFKPTSVQNLVNSIAEIAAAAPSLPFFYYHIPHLTGVVIDMIEFLQLAENQIPNLAGIKYTATTIHEYQACLHHKNGKYEVLYGLDEMLLPALSVGATGAIGSTYTYAAPLYLKVMELFNTNRQQEARELQYQLVQMVGCIVKWGPIPSQRAIMKMLGFEMGPSRLPLTNLSEEQSSELQRALQEIGFFELLEKQRSGVNIGEKVGAPQI